MLCRIARSADRAFELAMPPYADCWPWPSPAGTGLTPPILADCTEPLSEGSNFLDVLPAWMLIHP